MAGYSEAVDCPRCGGEESLERSIDHDHVYEFCTECGHKLGNSLATLEEVNAERDAFQMEPIAELKKPIAGWTDDTPLPVAEHQYDCKGNHRVVVNGEIGETTLYEHTAFVNKDGKWYMSVTPYYEGTLPSEMCVGVYELVPVNKKDASMVAAYNLFNQEEECPHLDKGTCDEIVAGKCPQRKKEDDAD